MEQVLETYRTTLPQDNEDKTIGLGAIDEGRRTLIVF